MNLTTEKNGEELIVHLSGELNTVTAPELKELLDENSEINQFFRIFFLPILPI